MRLRSSGGAVVSQSGLRHDAEHRAAVEAEEAVGQRDQLEVAERVTDARCGTAAMPSGARPASARRARRARRRVDERDERAFGARPRRLVDQPDAARLAAAPAPRAMSSTRSVTWCSPGRASRRTSRSASRAPSLRAARASTRPTGTKCARTRCDATSSARLDVAARARRDRTPAPPAGRPPRCRRDRGRAFIGYACSAHERDTSQQRPAHRLSVRGARAASCRVSNAASERARVSSSPAQCRDRSRAAMRSRRLNSPATARALEMVMKRCVQLAQSVLAACAARRRVRSACARNGRIVSTSSATPSPVVAIGLDDRRTPLPVAVALQREVRLDRRSPCRSAPSRSALLTTKMSAISMMPALSACTSSPVPGHQDDDARHRRCARCRLRPARRRRSR